MSKTIIHVGLDAHAQTIAIAIAQPGAEVRLHGSICQ